MEQNGIIVAPTRDSLTPTAEQWDLLKSIICPDANEQEIKFLLEFCQRKRLDPFTRQVYLSIRTQNKKDDRGNWSKVRRPVIQTGIDGLLSLAERTRLYRGSETWTEGDYSPTFNKGTLTGNARVFKTDCEPFLVKIDFWEFAQTNSESKNDTPTLLPMWQKMPKWMIQKVALACALRRAFPDDLGAIYTNDEIGPDRDAMEAEHTVVEVPRPRIESRRATMKPATKVEVNTPAPTVADAAAETAVAEATLEAAKVYRFTTPEIQIRKRDVFGEPMLSYSIELLEWMFTYEKFFSRLNASDQAFLKFITENWAELTAPPKEAEGFKPLAFEDDEIPEFETKGVK